jgi:hypothetical protein
MFVSKGYSYATRAEIEERVRAIEAAFSPDVVRIRYNLDEDWAGSPAIFFRVVLSDRFAGEADFYAMSTKVTARISDDLDPSDLGLLAYFNFRTNAEQNELKEATWE